MHSVWSKQPTVDSLPYTMGRPDQPQPALGRAIRELREKRNLSQEDLAHDAGITTGSLSMIERGRRNPTWGTVKAIAAALGSSVGELDRIADRSER